MSEHKDCADCIHNVELRCVLYPPVFASGGWGFPPATHRCGQYALKLEEINLLVESDLKLRRKVTCCSNELREFGDRYCSNCGACCANEDRDMNGGCRNCHDPCL